MADEEWTLYYYKFAGRGDFVRLMFEEAGVQYKEVSDRDSIVDHIIQGNGDLYPHFAPPAIKKGNFSLSQAHVICRYLAEKFNMLPETPEDRAHAEQVNLSCHDYIAEGRLAYHGINSVGPYLSQKEETQPYIDRFVKNRMPRWLKYLERMLKANNDGKSYVVGSKLTYVDLTLYQVLRATEAQFPEAWRAADYIPNLKAFKDRVAARPKIAAFLKSDRSIPFSGDSMM